MKTIIGLAALALFTVGCKSNPFDNDRYNYSSPEVDDDVLVYVPESERDEITKARSECDEMKDRVTIAENQVEQEKRRLDVAEEELDVAEAEVDAAKKALSVARNSSESIREREIDNADDKLENARARWRSAQSQIAFHQARIDQLQSEVELAEMRVELAEARVQLAKARAVRELDRPEADKITVSDFEACVEEKEAMVAMAEVDAEAWEKKVKMRQDALDERLENRNQPKSASYDKKD